MNAAPEGGYFEGDEWKKKPSPLQPEKKQDDYVIPCPCGCGNYVAAVPGKHTPPRVGPFDRRLWMFEEMGFSWDGRRKVFVHKELSKLLGSLVLITPAAVEANCSTATFQRAVSITVRKARSLLERH